MAPKFSKLGAKIGFETLKMQWNLLKLTKNIPNTSLDIDLRRIYSSWNTVKKNLHCDHDQSDRGPFSGVLNEN